MEEEVLIYFIGTAGSGKTSLVAAFQQWMKMGRLDAVTVNLDPGAEELPYEPDIDIRDWVDIKEIMKSEKLGPNGAQIVCADLLALKIGEVQKILEEFKTHYVLVDTPGQMELFTFRNASTHIVNNLSKDRSAMVFTFDPILSKTPSGFVSQLLLVATAQFRFNLPMIGALTKTDLLKESELEKINRWSEDADAVYGDLMMESSSISSQMSMQLLKVLEEMGVYKKVVNTSAEDGSGMEDIYSAIQLTFAGGEDLRAD